MARAILLLVLLLPTTALAVEPAPLDPATTWAYMVSTVEYKGGVVEKSWKDGRRDTELAKAFGDWGLKPERLVFLKDREGTIAAIREKLTAHLAKAKAEDTFVFYFAGHGGRQVVNRNNSVYWFENFDANPNKSESYFYTEMLFTLIDKHFKGSRALVLADCCHSGGITVVAAKHRTRVQYACLASVAPHNSSTGGWTFTNCLIAALRGDGRVDADGNGALTLGELNEFTQLRMAVLEQQRASFVAADGFGTKLKLADRKGAKPSGAIGKLLEAEYQGQWYRCEVLEEKPMRYKLDWPDWGTADWHPKAKTRPFEPKMWPAGKTLEAKSEQDDKWYKASVVGSFHGLHHVKFDGYTAEFNEWLRADRIRPQP